MNTILVWVLVSWGGYGGDQVTYSQPMPDLATCQSLQKAIKETAPTWAANRCVQIRIVVTR